MLYRENGLEIGEDGILWVAIGNEQFADIWFVLTPDLSPPLQVAEDLASVEVRGLRSLRFVRQGQVERIIVPASYADAPRIPYTTLPLGNRNPRTWDANWSRAEHACQALTQDVPLPISRYCQSVLGAETAFRFRLRQGDLDIDGISLAGVKTLLKCEPIDFSREDYWETPQYTAIRSALEKLPDSDALELHREFLRVPRSIQTNFGARQLVVEADFYHIERSTPIAVVEDWFERHFPALMPRSDKRHRTH